MLSKNVLNPCKIFTSVRCQQTQLVRTNLATVAAPAQFEVEDHDDFDSAKPYKDIPKVSGLKVLSAYIDKKQRTKLDQVMKSYHEAHGPIFKFRILGQPDRVIIDNPEMLKKLLSKDGKHPIEPGFNPLVYYRTIIRKELFLQSRGLIGSHGEDWSTVRSLVQQSMMRTKSAMFYINDLEDISEKFVNLLRTKSGVNDEVEDIVPDVHRWSLESIAAIFLNIRLGCLDQNLSEDSDVNRFINAVNTFLGPDFNDINMGPPIWKYVSTSSFKRWDEAQLAIYDFTKKYVDQAMNNYKKDDTEHDCMSVLQKMIKTCGLDSQIPVVMAQDALMAGVDTTGTTAAFLLLDLAQHPEQQEILFREVSETVQGYAITESHINKMKYLKACFQETVRLHPAVIGFSRTTQVDMVLEGYHIPKDTVVSYFIMNVMKEAKHFQDPDKFIPERWMRGCPHQHEAHPFATIPFAHGPRMCIGKRFAELECYILVIKMLQRFKLEYHHEPVGIQTDFVNKPDKKIRLRIIPRV